MNTIVSLSNIEKSFIEKKVLKNISLDILENKIHGFLGPNGAGKSTVMNIILGLIEPDAGEVVLASNVKIGYLPENLPLYQEMKVYDYLKFTQEIYSEYKSEELEKIITKLGLNEFRFTLVGNLSKGYKQRVALAASICHNPSLLILDEPLVGLDPHAIESMKEIIRDLSKSHTIFISSHQLHDLSEICDYISIIHEGIVIKNGELSKIESELRGGRVLEVEVDTSSVEQMELTINKIAKDLNIEVEFTGPGKFVAKVKDQRDIRLSLSKELADQKILLLSMKEEKLNLEDIFKVLTSSTNHRGENAI